MSMDRSFHFSMIDFSIFFWLAQFYLCLSLGLDSFLGWNSMGKDDKNKTIIIYD